MSPLLNGSLIPTPGIPMSAIGSFGSPVESAHAGEASHMFFGNGLGKPFLAALATHPPLAERIQAIDPGWDGTFRIS